MYVKSNIPPFLCNHKNTVPTGNEKIQLDNFYVRVFLALQWKNCRKLFFSSRSLVVALMTYVSVIFSFFSIAIFFVFSATINLVVTHTEKKNLFLVFRKKTIHFAFTPLNGKWAIYVFLNFNLINILFNWFLHF